METPIDLKSKIFFYILVIGIFISLGFVYKNYILDRNHSVVVEIPCDSEKGACFVRECEEGDPRCGGQTQTNYHIVIKKAYNFPPVTCEAGEETCSTYTCSEDSKSLLEIEASCE